MNKILKRSIFLSLMLMLILIGNIVVKADGNWINTSISISDNNIPASNFVGVMSI